MDYTLHIDRPCEQVIPELVNALQHQGWRAVISFDLQLARAGQPECPCPHHGTARCTCQYAVLLVYAPQQTQTGQRTITAHGRDGKVWLSLLENPAPPAGVSPTEDPGETELLEVLLSLGNLKCERKEMNDR
jgi:hypothetical protein